MRAFFRGTAVACLGLLANVSSADPLASSEESQRWVPSLSLTSGVVVDGARGEVESSVRPSAMGSQSLVAPFLGGALEIMTPAWEALGGRTRFFAHGGLAGNLGFERDLAKEGAPAKFELPPLFPGTVEDSVVRGQGSVTDTKPTGFQASAGLGVSFGIDTGWRRLRIKPSFEYLVEEIEVGGVVHRATVADASIPTFNFIAIRGEETKYFHGIGPGLEVEADVIRVGPVLVALLVSGSAYHILGDRDVKFSSTDATGAESASWSYRKDAWSYQGHVGLRFRWVPESGS